jgi:hypothetical protein
MEWTYREPGASTPPPAPVSLAARRAAKTGQKRPPKHQAKNRQKPPPPIDHGRFVQLPVEVILDRRLMPTDVVVFGWLCAQREMWNGDRAPIPLERCAAELGLALRTVKSSVKRLEGAEHLRVERTPGAPSMYASPWLNIHKLAQRMARHDE